MASISSALPALRRAAPRLSKTLFPCSQCSRSTVSKGRPTTLYLNAFRSSTRRNIVSSSDIGTSPLGSPSALASLSKSINQKAERARKWDRSSFFPKTSNKVVAYWLLGSAASVYGIVVFGGLTRLTESGFVPCNAIWMLRC